jgi:hypothetical protein
MNYYLDTEFIEDFHKPLFGRRRHFIDLISIGIVAEDGRQYFAVSNEFDLKYVWNKYDIKWTAEFGSEPYREYWLRDNVLKPLWIFLRKQISGGMKQHTSCWESFTYSHLRELIRHFGKSNKRIAKDIELFTAEGAYLEYPEAVSHPVPQANEKYPPTFYGYYADYDWVLFCSLFGRMLDLPKGYPMYCHDLKQMMDNLSLTKQWKDDSVPGDNEHHALADAHWNKKLHQALINTQNKQQQTPKTIRNEDY